MAVASVITFLSPSLLTTFMYVQILFLGYNACSSLQKSINSALFRVLHRIPTLSDPHSPSESFSLTFGAQKQQADLSATLATVATTTYSSDYAMHVGTFEVSFSVDNDWRTNKHHVFLLVPLRLKKT